METATINQISPDQVRPLLSRHLLTKSMMPLVLDMERSHGVRLLDRVTGAEYLDFFGFFATNTLGMNHPGMLNDPAFTKRLTEAALNKITNSDLLTEHKARFVDTFSRIAMPSSLPHVFFISGGALAVENALKTAFDWKVRHNQRFGRGDGLGQQVLHLREAFHGRSGYTMSLTNTDPNKTLHFPKFDWPRISNPKMRFPLSTQNLADLQEAEDRAIDEAERHFLERRHDIACVIVEPIQAEGGDNHFRPEFLRRLRDLAHENDALLIFDEVQSGAGITGSFWAFQSLGVEPDILAFGKKTQVCGILASRKIDEIDDNVFQVPSRINSTWGGSLVDMVRYDRILEIMEETDLLAHVSETGTHLLRRLEELASRHTTVTNARGLGLMCAFDLPDTHSRDRMLNICYEEGVVLLGCGPRSIRFRPPLVITSDEVDEGLQRIEQALIKAIAIRS